jgi:preprotein translocase subunit SecE
VEGGLEVGNAAMSTIEQVKPAPVRTAGGGDGGGGITNWWSNTRTFLTEVRNEMRRVTWPSRKEVYATTVVVILVSAFFGLYLWMLDLALNFGIDWIFRQFGAA